MILDFDAALADIGPDLLRVEADRLDEIGNLAAALELRLRAQVAAIIADPANDEPRLAYASICENYGQSERGEFIRLEVELAQPSHCKTCGGKRWYEISDHASEDCYICTAPQRERRRELLDIHPIWAKSVANIVGLKSVRADYGWGGGTGPGVGTFGWGWSRGFVSSITLTCANFMRHAAALGRVAPIERVTLSDKRALDDALGPTWYDGTYYTNAHDPESNLPSELYRLLEGGVMADHGQFRSYDSAAAANIALNAACVRYLRGERA